MHEELLRSIATNDPLLEAFHIYAEQQLREIAIQKVFDGGDVSGIPEAKKVLDSFFGNLKKDYGVKSKPVIVGNDSH